ncbi:hypothetical protein [Vagococcus bubulae]|uniref:Uncharacterized protein n=1 Tax=Vagococcus bubulae TaxID=1977868 RepID=A0A429ZNX6_9ENTE|nr:hypothetical protein [Vagococcus bubulae]RST95376.1 hypothetical protein CBF36_03840 [Vagococcus bubulae]
MVLNLFPTNNKAIVFSKGNFDRWGVPINDNRTGTEYNCIVLENTKLEKVPAGMDKYQGKEITFNAVVYFPEFVKVKSEDTIQYTDDLGQTHKRTVIQVQVKKDFGGSVLAVKAYV